MSYKLIIKHFIASQNQSSTKIKFHLSLYFIQMIRKGLTSILSIEYIAYLFYKSIYDQGKFILHFYELLTIGYSQILFYYSPLFTYTRLLVHSFTYLLLISLTTHWTLPAWAMFSHRHMYMYMNLKLDHIFHLPVKL